MFETLIVNAEIVDGTGGPRFHGELGIVDGRIAHLARRPADATASDARQADRATRTIDAGGQIVAPGFIDLHSHADFSIQGAPAAETQLTQGVTTSLVGNCGSSPFPTRSITRDNQHLEAAFTGEWSDTEGFITALEDMRPGINIALQIGLSTVRSFCMGSGDVQPDDADLRAMRREISAAAESGVFGFSSGLIYAPGSYADPREMVDLVSAAADAGLLHSTHMRNEAGDLLEAVDEAITTAERAGARLEISHLKALGPGNRGLPAVALERIEDARTRGLDVMADVYPYTASSTGLTSRLPGFAMDGGKDAMVERLAHPPMRAAIAEAVASRFGADIDPAGVIVAALGPSTTGDDYSWTIGLGLTEIGERDGCAPEEAAMRLLHAHDGSVAIVNHAMDPQDVEAVLAHPLVSIASDGWTLAATGAGRPHPRSFGTFARVLGHYVRDRGVMPLEEAIRKMTSQPADRLRLNDRGMLAIGKVADVVIFDAATVRDNATYSDPWQLSSGVSTVLLAGEAAVSDGAVTDRRCGRVLRRSA
jgi:N-acyl-D-amino-acid deacylase